MKKVILLAACTGLMSLTSCKKDRECVCTNATTGSTTSSKVKKISKSEAKDICKKTTYTVTYTGGSNSSVQNCELK